MSKKDKSATCALAAEFQAMISMVPKLAAFLKVHNEIATGYQKYRKNGGVSIPGIEKHLGIKEQSVKPAPKAKKTEKTKESKAAKETKATIKPGAAKKVKSKAKA